MAYNRTNWSGELLNSLQVLNIVPQPEEVIVHAYGLHDHVGVDLSPIIAGSQSGLESCGFDIQKMCIKTPKHRYSNGLWANARRLDDFGFCFEEA